MFRKHQNDLINMVQNIVQQYKLNGILPIKKIVEYIYPGGGKSTLPIIAGQILKDAGIIDKICIVVPRVNLKNQGALEFTKDFLKTDFKHNLNIREMETVNDVDPTRGADGWITTYQALAQAKQMNCQRTDSNLFEFKKHRTLLVLDEFHHVCENPKDKDGYSFFKAVKPLYDAAGFVLCMSGSIMRHERTERVAFVDYELRNDGQYYPHVDISYDQEDALRERAIIPTYYCYGHAKEISYTQSKGKKVEKISKEKIENNTDLSVALDTEYGWELLRCAILEWENYRANNPRSKLIIVGYDQKHCREIKSRLDKQGFKSLLAISDEKDSQNNIKAFRTKNDCPVLITCKMAYEGLDCKEATHLVCLTKIRSIPFLIQVLTRISRYDPLGKEYNEQQCFAYIPNDPKMLDIIKESLHGNPQPVRDMDDELDAILSGLIDNLEPPQVTIVDQKYSKFDALSQSDANGNEVSTEIMTKIQVWKRQQTGSVANLPEVEIFKFLKQIGGLHCLDNLVSTPHILSEEVPKTIREQEKEWRQVISKLGNKLDRHFGNEFGTWNKRAFNEFRKLRKNMSVIELKGVYDWMKYEATQSALAIKDRSQVQQGSQSNKEQHSVINFEE